MRFLSTLAFLVALTMAFPTLASAQAETTTTNQTIFFAGTVGNPCVPETVDIAGNMHVVVETTISDNGDFHFMGHLNFQEMSGTGQTSGTSYRATDAGTATFNGAGNVDSANVITNSFMFRLTGAGSTDNFNVKGLFHLTVTPDGETTAEVAQLEGDCSG